MATKVHADQTCSVHDGNKSIDESIHIERETSPAPAPPALPAPAPAPAPEETVIDVNIAERKASSTRSQKSHEHGHHHHSHRHNKARSHVSSDAKSEAVWTEVSRDLVVKDAIEGKGYKWSTRDKQHFVIKEDLDYVSRLRHLNNIC